MKDEGKSSSEKLRRVAGYLLDRRDHQKTKSRNSFYLKLPKTRTFEFSGLENRPCGRSRVRGVRFSTLTSGTDLASAYRGLPCVQTWHTGASQALRHVCDGDPPPLILASSLNPDLSNAPSNIVAAGAVDREF